MTRLHPTALVDPGAQLAADVEVGAYSIVGPHVTIGAGTVIGPHVVITGRTRIGARNRVFQFASIGDIPQDRKYGGEPTATTIGDDNVIREFVSIHAGTAQDRGDTTIGNGNLFLGYTHVAHDCLVGNNTTFSNNAQLAGHVTIGDWVVLGGFAGVHQFCRIGAHAMVAAGAIVLQDVPPFVTVEGYPAKPPAPTTRACAAAASPPRTSSPCAARTRRSIAKGSRSTTRRPRSRRRPQSRRRCSRSPSSSLPGRGIVR